MRTKPFLSFVEKRHRIWCAREAGRPRPWTQDLILQKYRFCNVYRELDTTTIWIRENWSRRYRTDPDLWFAMVAARLVNWPPTLARLEPLPWEARAFVNTLNTLATETKVFGPAYIVSTNGHTMPKPLYLAERVLSPLWKDRAAVRPKPMDTLSAFYARLTRYQGMGSFMAAQVVADVKNSDGPLLQAPDWWTWCAPGPGSLRGLNRMLGNGPVRTGLSTTVFGTLVNELRQEVNEMCSRLGWAPLCAQDVQNCLCEFDKYERVRLGEGAPRQHYRPAKA